MIFFLFFPSEIVLSQVKSVYEKFIRESMDFMSGFFFLTGNVGPRVADYPCAQMFDCASVRRFFKGAQSERKRGLARKG